MTSSPSTVVSTGIDFGVLTALQVERRAMVERLDDCQRVEEPGSPHIYYRGRIKIPGGGAYQVVVTQLIDPGNLNAAAETVELIRRWQPQYLLMVGIAGGIKQKGVNKGEVVVAKLVHYYELGKRMPGGEQRRPVQYRGDRILVSQAQNYDAADWKAEVKVTPPSGSEGFLPKVHFGPIGCGEQVIADDETIPRLLEECPQMLAVAMEAAGVAQAAENAKIGFLEIRGISDSADPEKDDRWHEYAAHVAAAFTCGFLRSKPVPPLEEQARLRSGDTVTSVLPLVILRAQSLRPIGADELLAALPEELRGRDHETVPLDFTDLVGAGGKLTDPAAAVERLVGRDSPLIAALGRRGSAEFVFHGLVHIPLAVLAGYLTTDRQAVRLHDFHPSPGSNTWAWPETGGSFPPLEVRGMPQRTVRQSGEVVVCVSVSYPVTQEQTRAVITKPLREIALSVPQPERSIVRSEAQTREYGGVFRQVLDRIRSTMPGAERVHLFYAGPVSLAFLMGQQISENIHPPVTAWNFRGQYEWGIDLAAASLGEPCIVSPPTTGNRNGENQ